MNCQSCHKEVAADVFFCAWCGEYLGAHRKGKKAGTFRRWVALALDPAIGLAAWLIPTALLTAVVPKGAILFAILCAAGYVIWALTLFPKGMTPGKLLLGLQVVDQRNGEIPGFWKMVLRELFGRFLSGLFFGLGYFWALFDKNGQAWHDKLANTVVIQRA